MQMLIPSECSIEDYVKRQFSTDMIFASNGVSFFSACSFQAQ